MIIVCSIKESEKREFNEELGGLLRRSSFDLLPSLKVYNYFSGEKGTKAEPQVKPPPKASRSINSPDFSFPCS